MFRESALPAATEIERARVFLGRHLSPTRLLPAPSLTALAGRPVLLKLESDLPTGSFKVRGALYALWCQMQARAVAEVVASSTGNPTRPSCSSSPAATSPPVFSAAVRERTTPVDGS